MATHVTLMYAFVYCDVYSYKKQLRSSTHITAFRPASRFSMKGSPQRVMIQYDVTVSTGVNLCDPVLETRLSGRLHLYYCLVGLRWLRPVTLCDIFDGWKWEANSRQESNPRVPLPCTELYGQPPALTILCTGGANNGFTYTPSATYHFMCLKNLFNQKSLSVQREPSACWVVFWLL